MATTFNSFDCFHLLDNSLARMTTSEPHVFPLGHEAKHAIIASLVLMGVAISLLFVRFYTRRHLIDAVQASDYMALLASVGVLSLS